MARPTDPIIADLEARMARAFRAQARAWRQEAGFTKAAEPDDLADAGLLVRWLAAWDRAAKSTREKILRPILVGMNRAFGAGQGTVVDDATRARDVPARPATGIPTAGTTAIAPAPPPIPVALPADPTPIDASLGITFQARDPRAADYINEHAAERVAGINETTRGEIARIVQRGLANGDSPTAMANRIAERFEEFAEGRPQEHIGSRAHLVAVTEVGDAYADGQLQAAKVLQSRGLDMEKSWLTTGGSKCCEDCQGNEAQGWIPIDEAFQSGDDAPLAHPACCCSLLTRMAPEDSMTKYATLADMPDALRKGLKPSQQNAVRRRVNKDGPGLADVHVDVPAGGKPKKRRPAPGARLLKSDTARRYTLGVVYEPMVEDTQGDLATVEEIEQACWDFNRQHLGTGRGVAKGALGIQHADWADQHGEIIESYLAPCDIVIGDEAVSKGTWLMGTIWSPENWGKVQRGELTGLSMGGKARRASV